MGEIERLQALLRDDLSARRIRDELAARKFDLVTYLVARSCAEDLLETIALFCEDDVFWDKLSSAGAELTPEQVARLAAFDLANLGVLLEAAGYVDPPPPPVDQLVDDAALARRIGLDAYETNRTYGAEKIATVRRDLRASVSQARRRIPPLGGEAEPRPSELRAVLREADRIGRWLIPVAVAGAASAMLEVAMHGAAHGRLAFLTFGPVRDAVSKMVDVGGDQLGSLLASRTELSADKSQVADVERWDLGRVLKGHRAAISELVGTWVQWSRDAPLAQQRDEHELLLIGIRQHCRRLNDLAVDYADESDTKNLTANVADVLVAVEFAAAYTNKLLGAGENPRADATFTDLAQQVQVLAANLG